MKKSLVMATLVAASTSMMAMDLQYFLGAGATRVDANLNEKGSLSNGVQTISFNDSYDFKDTALSLKAGCKKRKHLNTVSENTWTVFTLLFEH